MEASIHSRNSQEEAEADIFANVRNLGSSQLFDFLEQIVAILPDELKYRLRAVLKTFPREGDELQRVLEVVRAQWKSIRSEEWIRIALVGPARTGKSSLSRAILSKQVTPSRPIFSIVDNQGLEEFLGYQRDRSTPEEIISADIILLILDGRFGMSRDTVKMYRRLESLSKTVLVVLNKMDLVENPSASMREAREVLGANIFGTSIYNSDTIDRLLKAIVAANSRALYPLSRNFPEFRKVICDGTVTQSSFAAALVAAVPVPVSDLLPITAIQTAMLLKIARAFGFTIDKQRARELVPMLAAGALVREGAHRLRKALPAQKSLIAVSVSGLWTYLLGRAAVQYFEKLSKFAWKAERMPRSA